MKEIASHTTAFRRMVYAYFKKYGRDLPWRHNITPYRVVVSEIMLQQTQVDRVIPAFKRFVKTFPTFRSLATAPLRDVLVAWQGLGYNRRARFLHEVAQRVMSEYGGRLPRTQDMLRRLPGIGPNTAASICAFAFDAPVVFIETNIRSVYIAYFFLKEVSVRDKDILNMVAHTVDQKHPRRWYSALMDFGSHLKKSESNPSRKSAHYVRQKPFKGSVREMRGHIITTVLAHPKGVGMQDSVWKTVSSSPHFLPVIHALMKEKLLMCRRQKLYIV